jgi:hypothetical protein
VSVIKVSRIAGARRNFANEEECSEAGSVTSGVRRTFCTCFGAAAERLLRRLVMVEVDIERLYGAGAKEAKG